LIDPRAIVDPSAQIGTDVSIGPWTIIGPDVSIGDGCRIASHVVIKGPTRIGRNNRIFQFATIGEDTPAFAYKGEPTTLDIGDDNVIREGVTIHRGTVQDRGRTIVGSNNLFMAYVHIGHDCTVGSHIVMANNGALSGHCRVDDWAIISGYAGLPQRRYVGAHAFVSGMTMCAKDVPAFVKAAGNPACAFGLNVEGLRRRGFAGDEIEALREAYRIVYRRGLLISEALEALETLAKQHPSVETFRASIAASRNGIIRGRRAADGE
jgi:UDP-N-acetylglucosamine acyltransferase